MPARPEPSLDSKKTLDHSQAKALTQVGALNRDITLAKVEARRSSSNCERICTDTKPTLGKRSIISGCSVRFKAACLSWYGGAQHSSFLSLTSRRKSLETLKNPAAGPDRRPTIPPKGYNENPLSSCFSVSGNQFCRARLHGPRGYEDRKA